MVFWLFSLFWCVWVWMDFGAFVDFYRSGGVGGFTGFIVCLGVFSCGRCFGFGFLNVVCYLCFWCCRVLVLVLLLFYLVYRK